MSVRLLKNVFFSFAFSLIIADGIHAMYSDLILHLITRGDISENGVQRITALYPGDHESAVVKFSILLKRCNAITNYETLFSAVKEGATLLPDIVIDEHGITVMVNDFITFLDQHASVPPTAWLIESFVITAIEKIAQGAKLAVEDIVALVRKHDADLSAALEQFSLNDESDENDERDGDEAEGSASLDSDVEATQEALKHVFTEKELAEMGSRSPTLVRKNDGIVKRVFKFNLKERDLGKREERRRRAAARKQAARKQVTQC